MVPIAFFASPLHNCITVPVHNIAFAPRQSLRGKQKVFQNCSFAKSLCVAHMFNHGWSPLAIGGCRLVAVGSGWWLAIGGGWSLAVRVL